MDIQLEHKRHTLAHLLAAAVLEKYPDAQLTLGPAIENGFYYDIDFGNKEKPGEADLKKIEKSMRKILPAWKEFSHEVVDAKKAKEVFKGNKYKHELVDEITKRGEKITLYTVGNFTDLCRGGHVKNPTKEIASDSFTLDRIAGAYWRGDEKNTQLTRIYGLAFDTKDDLDSYIKKREEAKKRDHRKLGKELDLFTFSELVGSGLPMFTPKGTVLREEINRFSQELREIRGFQKVWIPHITKKTLYEISGHWEKFGDELFLVKSQETKDELVMKPMNCPHHQQIYASRPRSYKDLPIKYLETTTVYRDEKAGELLGLSRVRSITQDDSHVFCTPEQLSEVFEEILLIVKEFYTTLNMAIHIRLSYRDPSKPESYLGDNALWENAQKILKKTAEGAQMEYVEDEGEAAFYGPKIDFVATDSLDREWQVATAQLDFVQPERFKITYTDKNGSDKTPIMVHLAIAGSLERFLSVYIEHTGGNFPLWLSPVQVKVIPVSEKHTNYAAEITQKLKREKIRAELNASDESLGKRIRQAKLEKVPYFFVIGDEEIKSETVTVEGREGNEGVQEVNKIISELSKKIARRA